MPLQPFIVEQRKILKLYKGKLLQANDGEAREELQSTKSPGGSHTIVTKKTADWTKQGLIFRTLISIYSLIFYCKNRIIFYYRSRVTAKGQQIYLAALY